ncbi:MAG: hypothetical protein HFJ33_03055 [Clostridia bacterium]|nr:hypothetical protein [Clostridia bacterium]
MNKEIQSICENYELEVSSYADNNITEASTLFHIPDQKLVYGKSFFPDVGYTIEDVYLPQGIFRVETSPNKELLTYKSNSFLSRYVMLEMDNKCFTNNISLLQEGKNMLKKYRITTKIIPYYFLKKHLSNALCLAHEYITTKQLNKSELQDSVYKLQHTYCELAPRSLALLHTFEQNPKNCNMRNLCEQITSSVHNIDKLIELKSEDLFPHVER